MKQAKLQRLKNSSKKYGDNMNNVRRKTSRTFMKNRREFTKEKLMSLKQTKNNNNRNVYRCINEFIKGYQPTTNLVKDGR